MSIDERKFLENDDSFSKDGFEITGGNESVDSDQSFEDDSSKENDSDSSSDSENDNDYWTEETENAVIEFLYLNEFFFENRIKEEESKAFKQKREVNKHYCLDMQRRKEEVMLNLDRKNVRDKTFRTHIEEPLRKLVENILFNFIANFLSLIVKC